MNENTGGWGIGLLVGIVIGIFVGNSFEPTREQLKAQVEDAASQCEIVREDYQAALEEADEYITYANGQIADAQGYAWMSYEDMGYRLESLEEVNSTNDPQTSCY